MSRSKDPISRLSHPLQTKLFLIQTNYCILLEHPSFHRKQCYLLKLTHMGFTSFLLLEWYSIAQKDNHMDCSSSSYCFREEYPNH